MEKRNNPEEPRENHLENFITAVRTWTPKVSEKIEPKIDRFRKLVEPENLKLLLGSFAYPLLPEVILTGWQEYGKTVLLSFYRSFPKAFSLEQATVDTFTREYGTLENNCVDLLTHSHGENTRAILGLFSDTKEQFARYMELVQNLRPEGIAGICSDISHASEVVFSSSEVVPLIQKAIMRDLNDGFSAIRMGGIFMLAYSTFHDKISSAIGDRVHYAARELITNSVLGGAAVTINALLTYAHTEIPFQEALVQHCDVPLTFVAVMTLQRLLTEKVLQFKDKDNIKFVDFLVGTINLLSVVGLNSATLAKSFSALIG